MMRRVMELLGRLILDEVQRKTCASLPPDMREFLQWMLRVDDDDKPSEQVPPLPLVHNQEPHQHQTDKFLFGDSSIGNESAELDELNKKVRLLKRLIEEYNALTTKEKTKVQVVHDYLVSDCSKSGFCLIHFSQSHIMIGQTTATSTGVYRVEAGWWREERREYIRRCKYTPVPKRCAQSK
ncbi:uncharacterized protein LOC124178145 [Neodiprion fabricii]|uniref:uncharacterized protein LOC124178145 n=1 Tax=Neodiprion fabricii TaxID=2872261 RepID=UPI001ED8F61E|nr:uncharacterized protein LOC124178145 [Neodiprion fabricii]